MRFLGHKLKHLMDALGLSIPRVHEITGVATGHLSEIINGKRNPREDTVDKICKGLNINEQYFYLEESTLPVDFLPEMPPELEKFVLSADNIPWLVFSKKAIEKGVPLDTLNKILDALAKE